jgi:hypothetical protein
MFTYIFWPCVECQSCHKFLDLDAYKFSTSLDFCSQSYRQNTIARSVEKGQNREAVEDVVKVVEDLVIIVGGVAQAVGNIVIVSKK